MMEKRNFVTSSRTPMEGAADIDDIIEAGSVAIGVRQSSRRGPFEKAASAEDEKSDGAS